MTSISLDASSAPLEKTALETYVPLAKPSLVGLSRAEISDRLGEIGVAPAQRKMRVQQLWHWIYVRGAQTFDEMTSISKSMRDDMSVRKSSPWMWGRTSMRGLPTKSRSGCRK